MVTHKEFAPNTDFYPHETTVFQFHLQRNKSQPHGSVYLSRNVHFYRCTGSNSCVLLSLGHSCHPTSTRRTQTYRHKYSFPIGTQQLTNPYTQCLAGGQFLTSKLLLSRSESHSLVLFGCGAGDVPVTHRMRTPVVTQQPFY